MAGNAQERFDTLRLIRSANVGPVTFTHLLARFGSEENALAALVTTQLVAPAKS